MKDYGKGLGAAGLTYAVGLLSRDGHLFIRLHGSRPWSLIFPPNAKLLYDVLPLYAEVNGR